MLIMLTRRSGIIGEKGTTNIRRWLWNGTQGAINSLGRIGGAVVGVIAITSVVQRSVADGLSAAETAKDYARDIKNGDSAWADLDAIAIAWDVQDATGNYSMTYEALDILLTP